MVSFSSKKCLLVTDRDSYWKSESTEIQRTNGHVVSSLKWFIYNTTLASKAQTTLDEKKTFHWGKRDWKNQENMMSAGRWCLLEKSGKLHPWSQQQGRLKKTWTRVILTNLNERGKNLTGPQPYIKNCNAAKLCGKWKK